MIKLPFSGDERNFKMNSDNIFYEQKEKNYYTHANICIKHRPHDNIK